MIIDFHTHVFSPRLISQRDKYAAMDPLFGQLYANLKAKLSTADDLIAAMDEQGIAISVIQNISWSSPELCRETNDYILESISRYPKRLIGFCMVKLDSPEFAIPEIGRCVKGGIKGIGETRPDLKLFDNLNSLQTVIRTIIDNNLILLTHSSEPVGHIYPGKGDTTPEILYQFITGFPDLKLVCAHWGGGLPFYSLMPEVKKSFKNVYFDSAASPFLYNAQIYNSVAHLAGNEKILFGSDYPLLNARKLLNEIEALNLSSQIKNQILAENAARLLGISTTN
jgi:uncharacterized protein